MTKINKTVSWTPVSGATSYQIFVDDQPLEVVTASPYTLPMEENSTAQVQVRGINDGGPGGLSTKVSAVASNASPPPVNGLDDDSVNRGSFTVSWDYDNKPADFVIGTGSSAFVVTSTAGTVTVDQVNQKATITSAPDATTVTVTVKARDSGGMLSTAVTHPVLTPPAPNPAAPGPTAITLTHTGYASLGFSWSAVSGATGYQYSGDGVNWSGVTTARTYTWGGRAENTSYTFRVRVVGAGGTSIQATRTAKTLPKVKSTTPVFATRNYGYGQPYTHGALGTGHYQSGISASADNWANQSNTSNWLYSIDNNTTSGPFSLQGYRWIVFSTTLNFDLVYSVGAMFGYQGEFQWDAWNIDGKLVQTGRMDYPGGALTMRAVGPNILNASVTNRRISRIRLFFYPWGASPGYFKLSEWYVSVRAITSYTTVYNVA